MNKKIYLTLCLVLVLCLAGCGSPSAGAPDQDELLKTRATVTEVRGNTLLIRTEQGVDMTVPAKYLEGDVGPKAGMILEITSNNEILEIYPSQFGRIEKVEIVGYEALDDGAATKDDDASQLVADGTIPSEGTLGGFRYKLGEREYDNSDYKERGYYCCENDARAPLVIVLCSGERSTGGYGIRVADLEADEEGNLCVIVEEKAPKQEDVVTEAFTYPMATLLIYEETGMPSSVTVKTTGGMEFPFLGNLPPKSDTGEDFGAEQGRQGWKKVVIAPVEGAYCNISLQLPEDWGYSCSQTEDVPVSGISLGIYPKAEGDASGCIVIEYAEGFGVCGTGLESVPTTFNGHAASKGTYDGHPYWDFIALSEEYRGCSILNLAGETWFDQYEKELNEILATVEFTLSDNIND